MGNISPPGLGLERAAQRDLATVTPGEVQSSIPRASQLRCVVGVPSAYVTLTQFWANLMSWLQGVPLTLTVSEGNRVEINRSVIIGHAKSTIGAQRATGVTDLPPLLMLDTDVLPKISFESALSIFHEDFERGFDIVCSPLRKVDDPNRGSTVLFRTDASFAEPERFDRPFEVEAASFGMVFMSSRLIEKIVPIRNFQFANGSSVELYCDFSRSSEDYDLCLRAKELGFRVCCDPRLLTVHLKTSPIVSWTGASGS